MELTIDNNLNNNLEKNQNNFLNSALWNTIDNGIDIGIRCLLPDYAEDVVIELKDNMIKFGLKDGISKTINSAIEAGKSAIGIITGKFDNMNQINSAIKAGGIINSVSNILDDVLDKVKSSGKINSTITNLIKNGKDVILNNVEKNIETTLTNQITGSERVQEYINNWKDYYANKDFNGMEKEYNKIEKEMKELVPIENTINMARNIETLHNLIKNNGRNFNLTKDQLELVKKLNG